MSHATYSFLVHWDLDKKPEANIKQTKREYSTFIEQYGDENNWWHYMTIIAPHENQLINLLKEDPFYKNEQDLFHRDLEKKLTEQGWEIFRWWPLYYVGQCIAYDVCPHGHGLLLGFHEMYKGTPMEEEYYQRRRSALLEYLNTDFQYATGIAYLEKSEHLKAESVGMPEGTHWYKHKHTAAQQIEAYESADDYLFAIPGRASLYEWRAFDLREEAKVEGKEEDSAFPKDSAVLFVDIHT